MRLIRVTICLGILLSGCSTVGNSFGRTSYAPHSMFQGYSDIQLSPSMRVARFVGNGHTSHQEIALMSEFRAIEICKGEKYRLADIYDVKIPGSGGQIKAGYRPYIDTQENAVGYGFVPMDTYFACRNEIYLLGVSFRPVPSSEITSYAKDGKGAMRVEGFLLFSPNQGLLKTDDLVLAIDGKRVSNISELKAAVGDAKDKDHILAQVVSGGRLATLELKAKEATVQLARAQDEMVSNLCRNYPGASDSSICGAKTAK